MLCSAVLILKYKLINKGLPRKIFDYANLIRVCAKTNGNIIRITLNNNISYVDTLVTRVGKYLYRHIF